jgi:histidinol phosphatase-like PHP family hydrolase
VASSLRLWPGESGLLFHAHSDLGRPDDGRGFVPEIARQAAARNLAGVIFAEHTSNPGHPKRFADGSPEAAQLIKHFTLVRQSASQTRLMLVAGIEANIMSDGTLDAPVSVLEQASFVIASGHGGFYDTEKLPAYIERRIITAASNPYVHCIGHPTRHAYCLRVSEEQWQLIPFDWFGLYEAIAATGCAVEINLNQLKDYWKVPDKSWKTDGYSWLEVTRQFLRENLRDLARSGALVFIGHDLHNSDMWLSSEVLKKQLDFIAECGITPDRVINNSVEKLTEFMSSRSSGRP